MGSAFFGLGPAEGFSGGPPFDLGYVAIALTLLAGSRPGGVVLAALFYGALTTGAKNMAIVTGIPLALLVVIVTFAIMFVAAPGLIRSIWRLKPQKPVRSTPEVAPHNGSSGRLKNRANRLGCLGRHTYHGSTVDERTPGRADRGACHRGGPPGSVYGFGGPGAFRRLRGDGGLRPRAYPRVLTADRTFRRSAVMPPGRAGCPVRCR